MGERKVLNKYYPPDWDPSTLTKTIKPKNGQVTVRLMLPMSIQCQTCGEYIHKGKKFNGRKEEAIGEAYLGIKVWRFYLKCTTCLSELTFKTDPKRNDYTVENGASRNFEPWKQRSREEELEAKKKAREESGDNMKVLENRSEASKREMDISDAIEEVRELNARAQALSTDQLLDIHSGGAARWEEAQIEEMAQRAFAAKRNGAAARGAAVTAGGDAAASAAGSSAAADSSSATATSASSSSLPVLKRLPDAVDLAAEDFRPAVAGALDALEVPDSPTNGAADGPDSNGASAASSTTTLAAPAAAAPAAAPAAPSPLAGLVLVKKRKADDGDKEKKKKSKKERKEAEKKAANGGAAEAAAAPAAPSSGLGGLLGSYADDSD